MKQITEVYKHVFIFRCDKCKNKFRGERDELKWMSDSIYSFYCPVCEKISNTQELEEFIFEDTIIDD